MGDLWDLGVVGLNEDAVIESAVSSGGSNCRVESVAKAHISELTLRPKTTRGVRARRVVQQPKNVEMGGQKRLANTARSSE